ncbi:MAG: hypothetical protein Q4A32_02430 [Lachnospiraceae bacterium]|nr:hypothetical protein [Lachnospiraceae bacterium]
MGRKDKKQKGDKKGRASVKNSSLSIEGLDRLSNADNQSVSSAPSMRRYAGNEFNMLSGANVSQLKEDAKLEEQHKKKSGPPAKDQNVSAPKTGNSLNAIGGMAEQEKHDDSNGVGSLDHIPINYDFELQLDEHGMPIISNEIPPKKMPLNDSNINNIVNENNIIDDIMPPGNEPKAGGMSEPENPMWSMEPDLVAEAPRKKKKAQAVSNANGQNIMNEPEEKVEGLSQVSDVRPFVPQYSQRHGYSGISQANDLMWRGLGNTVKVVLSPATFIGKIVTVPIKNSAEKKISQGQQQRNHRVIPGWNGAKYQSSKNTGRDILDDFRRVPTVWSYLTAGKADDKDGYGTPLPPKVTAYVEQPKPESSRSMTGKIDVGHAFIGIEYTRKSKITGRNERYSIKYGFYPTEGFNGLSGSAMMASGAKIPGKLADDRKHTYSISRTYPATREQIETIAKKSENYNETAGYAFYTRNCTTFVRDMFEAANLPSKDKIFTMEKVRFATLGSAGTGLASAGHNYFDTHLQRQMKRFSQEDDKTYQGEGNKRITAEEFRQYRETKNSSGFGQKGYIPAAAGENMRRLKDNSQLGSYRYAGTLATPERKTADTISIDTLQELSNAIDAEKRNLSIALEKLLPDERQIKEAGNEFYYWTVNLPLVGNPISELNDNYLRAYRALEKEEEKKPENEKTASTLGYSGLLTWKQVKTAHENISADKKQLSEYYQTVLKSDIRLNRQVMNLLSLYEISLATLDNLYNTQFKDSSHGDLGNIREKMLLNTFEIQSGDNKLVEMTPTRYEAYLQVYKNPEAAIAAFDRLTTLRGERNRDSENMNSISFGLKWSGKRQEEYEQLIEKNELAEQYEAAHRYMLNKDSFNQQDIDYAFKLRRRERHSEDGRKAKGQMYTQNMTMASAYIGIFFEKIFGGMRQEAMKKPENGGLQKDAQGYDLTIRWIDDYLSAKTSAKMNGMTAIVRGIKSTYRNPTHALLEDSFYILLTDMYLMKVFPKIGYTYGPMIRAVGRGMYSIIPLMRMTAGTRFPQIMSGIIDQVLGEDNQAGNIAVPKAVVPQGKKEELKKKKKK